MKFMLLPNRTLLSSLLPALLLWFTLQSEPVDVITGHNNLQGAWSTTLMDNGTKITQQLLLAGPYYAWTEYKTEDGAFVMTKGGSWKLEGDQLIMQVEFHTRKNDLVGTMEKLTIEPGQDALQITLNDGRRALWRPIDQVQETSLTGAWLFAGRQRDGQMTRRNPDQPRKTMKLLTGSHFQWIAFNTDTKEFFGTGGGSYSAEEGAYVEQIEFFSRDNARVGMQLEFDFNVMNGEWHHSGQSSSGQPMYEIWTKREK